MKQRIVDKKLLREIIAEGCLNHPNRVADPHHIISRGAGGDDVPENIIPLCRECHTALHTQGIFKFSGRFPMVKLRLRTLGWKFNEHSKLERMDDGIQRRID